MPDLSGAEWLLIAVVVLVVFAGLWLVIGNRRHVEIAPPENTASPTLSRVASPAQPLSKPIIQPLASAHPIAPPMPTSSLIPEIPPEGTAQLAAIAPAVGESDDLLDLKGVGPKLAQLLNSLGVRRFDQIAAWTDADIAEVDRHLGNFAGRIGRDRWVEQARLLAAGDIAGFESRFGKLDSRQL